MIYSDLAFLVFLFITVSLYFFAPRKSRKLLLVFSSLFFLAWGGAFDTVLFLLISSISWLAVSLAGKFSDKKRLFLNTAVFLIASNLLFWKYGGWLVDGLREFTREGYHIPFLLPLPLGISFYTLQSLAYLIDVKRGRAESYKFTDYLLFKGFFAQLIAGPICRVSQLMPQISNLGTVKKDDLQKGLGLFLFGFFKKLVVADNVRTYVDLVFRDVELYGRGPLILAALGFSVQIWADFSGYTDMGRGAARMIGIRLPENFLSPYLSRSPSEFWRRWHITLTDWIRDYIYYPLALHSVRKSSKGLFFLAALLSFVIAGLWHGAGLNFLAFGLFHGLLFGIESILKTFSGLQQKFVLLPKLMRFLVPQLLVYAAVSIGLVFFRVESTADILTFFKHIISSQGISHERFDSFVYWGLIFCFLSQFVKYYDYESQRFVVLEKIHALKEKYFFADETVSYNVVLGFVFAVTFVLAIKLRASNQPIPFIYFQF